MKNNKLTLQENKHAQEISRLVAWVNNPTDDVEELRTIFDTIETSSLVWAALSPAFGDEVSTLAWAEMGRRRGVFNYEFSITSTGVNPKLSIRGALGPVARLQIRGET